MGTPSFKAAWKAICSFVGRWLIAPIQRWAAAVREFFVSLWNALSSAGQWVWSFLGTWIGAPVQAATVAVGTWFVSPPYRVVALVLLLVFGGLLGFRVTRFTYLLGTLCGLAALLFLFAALPANRPPLLPGNWHTPVLRKYVLPWIVPLALLLAVLVLVQRRPRLDFQAHLVADDVSFVLPDDEELPITFSSLAGVVPPGDGTQLTLPALLIDGTRTTVPGLKARPSGEIRTLKLTPLPAPGADRHPYYRLGLGSQERSGKSPPARAVTVAFQPRPPGGGIRPPFQMKWDSENPESLAVDAAAVAEVRLAHVQRFELVLSNCRVTSAGENPALPPTADDVGEAEAMIAGTVLVTRPPVTFTLDGPAAGRSDTVELLIKKDSTKADLAELGLVARNVLDPRFGKVHSGKVVIVDDHNLDWKPEDDLIPQQVAIDGPGRLVRLRLEPKGIHAVLRGQSSSIKADGHEEMSDSFSVLLKSSVVVGILAFLAWSIDKMVTVYTAK